MSTTVAPDWSTLLATLAEPFAPNLIKYRAGATTKDKTKAQALPYVDPRDYERRLDVAAPGAWGVDFEPWGDTRVICRLTIYGVTRASTGEAEDDDRAIAVGTAAEAQAFKRACSKFGLGRHLYDERVQWVAYDSQKRKLLETPKPSRPSKPQPQAQTRQEAPRQPDAKQEAKQEARAPQPEPRDVDDLLERALQEYEAEQKQKAAFDPNHRERPAATEAAEAAEDNDPERYLTKKEAQQLHIYLAQRYGDYVKRQDHYDVATEALGRSITSFTQVRVSEEKAVRKATRQRAFENKCNQSGPVRSEASYRGYN